MNNDYSYEHDVYEYDESVEEEEEVAKQFIIHPLSTFRLIWDLLTLFMLLLNLIMIPFGITYYKGEEFGYLFFKMLSDLWFLIDILLNLNTGVVVDSSEGEVELDLYKCRSTYLKTWFIIDLVSTIPFDVIFSLESYFLPDNGIEDEATTTNRSGVKAMQLFRLIKLFSLLRILRVSKFVRYVKLWQEMYLSVRVETAVAVVRMLNLICILLYVCHFNSCLQYLVPSLLSYPEQSWVVRRGLNFKNVSVWDKYTRSVFRSTSQMLGIGYGEDTPHTISDIWVAYFSMVSGALCFAMFIGYASALIQSIDASKRLYKEKYMQVKEYMAFRKLPDKLRKRIADYYEYRFQGKMFDEDKILNELNPVLRTQIFQFTCQELMLKVPFFEQTDKFFVDQLLVRLQFEVFLMDDEIIAENDIATKMYFVNRGSVCARNKNKNSEQVIPDGSYFGELALIYEKMRFDISVTAVTCCYLYSLSTEDFNEVLEDFPQIKKEIEEILLDEYLVGKLFTINHSASIMKKNH